MNSSWMMIGVAFWFLARWKIDGVRWRNDRRKLIENQRELLELVGQRENNRTERATGNDFGDEMSGNS
jgi:hypothetical protein